METGKEIFSEGKGRGRGVPDFGGLLQIKKGERRRKKKSWDFGDSIFCPVLLIKRFFSRLHFQLFFPKNAHVQRKEEREEGIEEAFCREQQAPARKEALSLSLSFSPSSFLPQKPS